MTSSKSTFKRTQLKQKSTSKVVLVFLERYFGDYARLPQMKTIVFVEIRTLEGDWVIVRSKRLPLICACSFTGKPLTSRIIPYE
jgi:hypothetical protein